MAGSSSQETIDLSQKRKQFQEEILKIIYSSPSLYEWRTKEWIQNKIRELEENKTFCNMYQVQETCGNKVLLIGKCYLGNYFQVIPIEDYFDVIYAAHIFTGHGTIGIIKQYLKNSKLLVPHSALICFLKMCGACKAIKFNKSPKGIMYHGYLELIDMSDTPDGVKKFVMHYKALRVRRVYMRPLSSSSVTEVAEQLLKLFCEVGPPCVLCTPSKSFTKALILRLAIVYPDYKIICGNEMELEQKAKSLKAKIRKWMIDNSSSEWSKAIYYPYKSGFFKRRLKRYSPVDFSCSPEPENNVFDLNLPGPSSMQQETILKKQPQETYLHPPDEPQNKAFNVNLPGRSSKRQKTRLRKHAHETHLHKNISTDEVLRLLKPTKTYRTITPQTVQLKSLLVANNQRSQKKVCKTYTRQKKEKSQIILPLTNTKEVPLEKRALCINTNLKECKKPSKSMKKIYDVWNSTLDLPDQTESNVKNIIGINILSDAHFGIIPKEPDAILDNVVDNEFSQLSFPNQSFSDALKIKNNEEYNEVRQSSFHNESSTGALQRKNIEVEVPSLETASTFSALEDTVIKEEMLPYAIAEDFSEETTCFDNFESKYIKEERSFETPTTFNDQKNNIIKQEDQSFGIVVKVESCIE